MIHSHEESVQHNAKGDGEITEWIHDHKLDFLLDHRPQRTTVPDEKLNRKTMPARGTLPLGFLKL